MAYEKRVCILKQVKKGFSADGSALSGAVYCERLGADLTLTPRILGIAPLKEGRYGLAVCAEGETAFMQLDGNKPLHVENFPSIKGGLSVLLVFMRGDVEPVAFGSCGVAPQNMDRLLTLFREEEGGKRKKEAPPPAEKKQESGDALRPFREEAASRYDDEAIADVDYFRHAGDADGLAPDAGTENMQKEEDGDAPFPDAGDAFLRPQGSLTYYNTVREKLTAVFARYPGDERLKKIFPHSRWVNAGGTLLGVIYEEGIPKFLCVAAEDTGDLPPAMKERGCFVPTSHVSDMVGLYVVFQSADSGEYVEVKMS